MHFFLLRDTKVDILKTTQLWSSLTAIVWTKNTVAAPQNCMLYSRYYIWLQLNSRKYVLYSMNVV